LKRRTFLGIAGALPFASLAQSWAWDDGTTPFVVSPYEVVDRMLRLAEPKAGERLIDLGSGDGRIVIEAAKRYGTRGLGVDIDPRLVERAQANARKAGVEALARFEVKDFYELDLRGASIVSAYLLPEVNLKLMPRLLEQLAPGARIVTHDYDMGPWHYDEMIELPVAEKMVGPMGRSKIYLFVVPAKVAGAWASELPQHGGRWAFEVKQQYQELDIGARAQGREQAVRGSRLRGEDLRLMVTGVIGGRPWNHLFRGVVKGDRIDGELVVSNGEDSRTYPWQATRTP
jgi:SAM-dependent methyltransferase